MSRAYTEAEVRGKLLTHIHELAFYWSKQEGTPKDLCDGLAFSILTVFDGGSMALPALNISLAPDAADKEYMIEEEENWFEPGMVINDCQLHELYLNPPEPSYDDKG